MLNPKLDGSASSLTPTIVGSVRNEVMRHHRSLLDVRAAAHRIAVFHKCSSDLLIRQALLKQGARARIIMRL